jgi:hypothetical protein
MFRQPDSLYAGVLLCSAIILAVVGGSLFWLRMPGDERLRNYRLSRRFVGWAYFSLAFTDVLWLLFLREEYELDFTRILVLDGADQFRHRYTRADGDMLGLELVIYQGVELSRIVTADIVHVTLVHPHDAEAGQLEG